MPTDRANSSTTLSSAAWVLTPASHERIAELDALHGAGWARARLAEAAAARERLKVRRLSATSDGDAYPAPTAERLQNGYILPPVVTPTERRDAPKDLDVVARYEQHLPQKAIDALRDYTTARIELEAATWALNNYQAKVDQGGWKSIGGLDSRKDEFHAEAARLERLHRKLTPQMRAAADALTDAIRNPRKPCPFESYVARINPQRRGKVRKETISLLNKLAAEIQL